MKGKLATYSYSNLSTPRFVFASTPFALVGLLLLPALVVSVLYFHYQSSHPVPYVFGSAAALALTFSVFFRSGPGIIVASKYFILGEKTILYQNIRLISIDETQLIFTLTSQTGRVTRIHAGKFKSNANKDWKIKKNRREKFYKVVTKITVYALKDNRSLILKVHGADRFRGNQRAVFL